MRRRALMAAGGLALSGCGWMFPDDRDVPDGVRQMFVDMGAGLAGAPGQDCEIALDRIRQAAIAPDPHGRGGDFAWFIAPTDSGGLLNMVVQLDADGDASGGGGGGGGCEPPPDADGLWWSGGSGSDAEVVHGGHAPEGARRVRLTFGDEEPVVTDVNADGYFLVVLAESACCEWSFPELLEALDGAGAVIASTNDPMG